MTLAHRAYQLLRQVPPGRVTTYKALAHALGTRAYRAIGQAMRNNPYAPEVPCHRVVAANGTIGGFMGKKTGPTVDKKIRLLASEGVHVRSNKVVDFHSVLYTFPDTMS
jgi:methylated-DNA-[protein]-cysteine S-methyltransferase